jgi:hypothetical protein
VQGNRNRREAGPAREQRKQRPVQQIHHARTSKLPDTGYSIGAPARSAKRLASRTG